MDNVSLLRVARYKRSANAAKRRATTIFTLSWRGGGASQVTGFDSLAAALSLKPASIPVLLSKGGGSFALNRTNPLTGEQDIVTVHRVPLPTKPAAKRGRPRTKPLSEAEMQAGMILAPPARTVPKPRNRRTDEKQ